MPTGLPNVIFFAQGCWGTSKEWGESCTLAIDDANDDDDEDDDDDD